MRILFFSAWYPNRYDPMPGLFVKQHAEAVAVNHQIAVLYVHPCESKTWEIDQKYINEVFTTIVYYPSEKRNYFGSIVIKAFRFLKAHYYGYKKLKTTFGKPHLIHVNILTRCGVAAILFKYLSSIPFVITEHWTRYLPSRNTYSGFLRKLLTYIVVNQCKGVVAVSHSLKEAMQHKGLSHKNFWVIPNSVDTLFFLPSSKKNMIKKVFSHISCFDDAAKNISGIIRVVYELSKTRQDFELHLIGDGPDKLKMEELSESLGLINRYVYFLGLSEDEDLIKAYQESLFTILFSNYENMPVVLAESFSCGIPVIATNVGGISEVVNSGNGILIEALDESGLLLAIEYMLNNSSEFNAEQIRQFAENTFGKYVFAKTYNEFYSVSLSFSDPIN